MERIHEEQEGEVEAQWMHCPQGMCVCVSMSVPVCAYLCLCTCCMNKLFLGGHTHMSTHSDREPTIDQSMVPPKSWWTSEFSRVTYRNMGEGLLPGAQMTQYSYQRPPDCSQSWDPGAHCTATCRQLNRGRLSFPDLNLFQAAPLVSSSGLLRWFQSHIYSSGCLRVFAACLPSLWGGFSAFIAYSGKEGPSESGQLQGIPDVYLLV